MDGLESPDPSVTSGCMECKRPQPYTVEHFDNGTTGWRCTVCGKILRLVPGKAPAGQAGTPPAPPESRNQTEVPMASLPPDVEVPVPVEGSGEDQP
jgi:hypothetical protein